MWTTKPEFLSPLVDHLPKKSGVPGPATLLTSDVVTPAVVTGTSETTIVTHNGALTLITLRCRLRDIPVGAARAAFKVDHTEYPAGSFIVRGNAARVRKEVESLGLRAAAVATAPTVETVDVDLPRLAIYSTWASTEKVVGSGSPSIAGRLRST